MKTELQKQFEKQTPTIAGIQETEYLQTFISWLHLQVEKAEERTIEKCKNALLKQLHYVMYPSNLYPIEAVPKATILSLDKLIKN